jgi:predicted TIM-barrel fold metal-dependent hydrolase
MSVELRYVDAHSHVWTTDVVKFPPQSGVAMGNVDRGWTVEDWSGEALLAAAAPSGVGRAVLIGHGNIYGYDNSYMLDCCSRYPSHFRVVAQIDDRRSPDDLAATMRSLLRQGVRIHVCL